MTNWEKHFRDMKKPLVMKTNVSFGSDLPPEDGKSFGTDDGIAVGPVEETIGSGVLTSQNIEAIRNFFSKAEPVTPAATKIKDAFITWYDGLYWYQKMEQSNYDLARNQRNTFELANAVTPEAKATVQSQMKSGVSTEDMQKLPDRRDSTGMLPGPKTPPGPGIPTPVIIVVGVALGVVILEVLKKVL